MCLITSKFHQTPDKPFNTSKIRWKIFLKNKRGYHAPIYFYEYKSNAWNDANVSKYRNDDGSIYINPDTGFHVFLTRKDARKYKRFLLPGRMCVIRKVYVENFLCAGLNSCVADIKNETWLKLKIIN